MLGSRRSSLVHGYHHVAWGLQSASLCGQRLSPENLTGRNVTNSTPAEQEFLYLTRWLDVAPAAWTGPAHEFRRYLRETCHRSTSQVFLFPCHSGGGDDQNSLGLWQCHATSSSSKHGRIAPKDLQGRKADNDSAQLSARLSSSLESHKPQVHGTGLCLSTWGHTALHQCASEVTDAAATHGILSVPHVTR